MESGEAVEVVVETVVYGVESTGLDPETCTWDVEVCSYVCDPWDKGVVDDASEFFGVVEEVVFYNVGEVIGSEFSYEGHVLVQGGGVLAGSEAVGEENNLDSVGGNGSGDGDVVGGGGGVLEDAVVN